MNRFGFECLAAGRVALVTCAAIPGLEPDSRLLIAPLAARGIAAEIAVWDDPAVRWDGYDLAVVRSCWDYPARRAEFLAWARAVPRLANPAGVIDWNTDKRYLDGFVRAGLPVVPTTWLPPGREWAPPASGEWVVKPAVSLSSLDTGRYRMDLAAHRRLAGEHLARLHSAGRTAMVQPYLPGVDVEGETALVYLGGRFSHAMRRGPALEGPDTGEVDRRFVPGGGLAPYPVRPTPEQAELAERVLGAAPVPAGGLLYARVDLVPGPAGTPVLMELELTEPSLYLDVAGAAERMAAEIARRIGGAGQGGGGSAG